MNRIALWMYLACLATVIFPSSLIAQKKIVFGKVSQEELAMKTYPEDTTAGAVILSDIGKFSSIDFYFRRHIRVKILKKSGLNWGNWVFNTPEKSQFKVAVFNLVNGETVKEKAENESIYNEKVMNQFEIYKVFAPGVRVGSVIDISYYHIGIPYEWRFQERIPVVYSNLVLEKSEYVNFSKTFFGFEPITTVSPYEWQATNVPAFRSEDHLSNYTNYITKFVIEVNSVNIPNYRQIDYSKSWRQINDNLMDFDNFGGIIKGSNFLNSFAKELKNKTITPEEKIKEAFDYIRKNIKWNGSSSAFASQYHQTNFEDNHSGNSADVNLALIALLNKIGITTYAIVLSTRDNGLINEGVPTLNKLNYVVAFVRHEGTEKLLDATSDVVAPGILPFRCLNGRGLLVIKDNEQWITLHRNNRYSKTQYLTIDMKADGNITAKMEQSLGGYAFLHWLEERKGNEQAIEARRIKLQNENSDLQIISYTIKEDLNKYKASESIKIDMSNYIVDAGDELLFSPFVLSEHLENPFKETERKYPVDFGYMKDYTATVLIPVPKEFTVKKIPSSVKFSTRNNGAEFIYLSSVNESGMTFKVTLKVNTPVFGEGDYAELQTFFSEVVKSLNAPVQLAKI